MHVERQGLDPKMVTIKIVNTGMCTWTEDEVGLFLHAEKG